MIKINGSPIKTPQRFFVRIRPVQGMNINALGETLIDRTAVKRDLELEYGPLTNTEISTILAAITPVYFEVAYPDPVTGASRTMIGYVGEQSTPMYSYQSNTPKWEGLSLTLSEK
jgi:hypothetical protein